LIQEARMTSRIDVRSLTGRVRLRLQLASYGADVSAELTSADARILAQRLIAAADEADQERSLTDLVAALR